jgi:leucine dehydrogenase
MPAHGSTDRSTASAPPVLPERTPAKEQTMNLAPSQAFDFLTEHEHERLLVFYDRATGLRGAIALHSTRRGPAMGGTRLRTYASLDEGIQDALRLSEAMTYKAAVAGLPVGGGKGVLLADGQEQDPAVREARFQAYGRIIEELGGRFVTAEDANTSPEDMVWVKRQTRHVAGAPVSAGGSGDPSPMTALGILHGIKALADDVLGTTSLTGIAVAIQGLGKVGMSLAQLLVAEGAAVTGADARPAVARIAREALGIAVVEPEAIYDVPCAIFAPCAYGGAIGDDTISRLTCRIVAGAANNQLQEERHGELLHERGIVFAVDYVINAGGLIQIAQELAPEGYDEAKARAKTAGIYHTIKRLLETARREGISTQRAAHRMALDALRASEPAGIA